MEKPLFSVIIPCFNQGHYIYDALESVLAQSYDQIEIIIVNDGSTDDNTIQILNQISHQSVNVIHTNNEGLSNARNNGIRASKGKYILPLDADDKIAVHYIAAAVEILEQNPNVGVVYGRAEYFGELHGEWKLEKFDPEKMHFYNQVYASAVFRRADFDLIGGYKPEMRYGWEDWEFWLSFIDLGREFYFLNSLVFFYRITPGSMVRSMTELNKQYSYRMIYCSHPDLYNSYFSDPISLWHSYNYYKKKYEKWQQLWLIKNLKSIYRKVISR